MSHESGSGTSGRGLTASAIVHRLPPLLDPRRGECFDIAQVLEETGYEVGARTEELHEDLWEAYRALCGVMYNFVPTSGHPGGSLSAGRLLLGLLFDSMDYVLARPDAGDADRIVFAAGHKALGLYAAWALRDELARLGGMDLPAPAQRLRWDDLLGFRRNRCDPREPFDGPPVRPLDGHPTPLVPFVPVATGASGVGLASAVGLALGLLDHHGPHAAPRVHVLEGEGGLTPGRVQESLAAAATMGLSNLVLHVDWNQASIDSDRVCRDGAMPGDYVQWNPMELGMLHDWNVLVVQAGHSVPAILAAQWLARGQRTGQPTMVVYRTVKGIDYGIQGRRSHGAGHAYGSDEYVRHVLEPFERHFDVRLPRPDPNLDPTRVLETYRATLLAMRAALEKRSRLTAWAVERLEAAARRLAAADRKPRQGAPNLDAIHATGALDPAAPPEKLRLVPGTRLTLREALGKALAELNRATHGAVFGASADLLGSTSLALLNEGFAPGFYHSTANPESRLLAVGGICEDAMGGIMAGLSAAGHHMGVASSYGAFIAALEHVPARLHCIGQQARQEADGAPLRPFVMVNGHAGIKTGEDGPTHADPQPLQLLQENFPRGTLITLVPWEPAEVWPLLVAALKHRPAVIAPFVTRPTETVPDREALGLPPPQAAVTGLYRLVTVDPAARRKGALVLQGSEVALTFVQDVLPRLRADNIPLEVFYVASAELFDLLPETVQEALFPESLAQEAMGITGFTLPTLYRWVTSRAGRRLSLYPFKGGRYLSSGKADRVMHEAGLDGPGMWKAIQAYLAERAR